MIDHVTLNVSDFSRSRHFYDKVLQAIWITRVTPDDVGFAGYGRGDDRSFWLGTAPAPISPVHLAFGVDDRATVIAFHAAALAAGGRDNGGPGLRPQYHPNYYAAFIIDPDGHNIEAVCNHPE